MTFTRIRLLAVGLVFFALPLGEVPVLTQGTAIYVATDGSDYNDGSESMPFRSFNRALEALNPGGVLYIRGGSYGRLSVSDWLTRIPAGTSWYDAITITAAPGETVTLRGISVEQKYAQYLIFDRLTIDARYQLNEGVWIGAGAHHIRLSNLEIKNAAHFGIHVSPSSPGYNEILNANIHHNGTRSGLDHGIYISTRGNVVDGSTIHNNAAYGVHIYSGPCDDNVVRNSHIFDNGTLGGTTAGILLGSGARNVAYNNVLLRNDIGIQADYYSPTYTEISRNTIVSSRYIGIYIGYGSSRATVQDNVVHQTYPMIVNSGSQTVLSNNADSAPQLLGGVDGVITNILGALQSRGLHSITEAPEPEQ